MKERYINKIENVSYLLMIITMFPYLHIYILCFVDNEHRYNNWKASIVIFGVKIINLKMNTRRWGCNRKLYKTD